MYALRRAILPQLLGVAHVLTPGHLKTPAAPGPSARIVFLRIGHFCVARRPYDLLRGRAGDADAVHQGGGIDHERPAPPRSCLVLLRQRPGRAVESLLPESPFEIRHSGHGCDVGDVLHVDPRLVEYLFRYHCGLFKIHYICIEARSAGDESSRPTLADDGGRASPGTIRRRGVSIRSGSVAPGPQPVETARATTRNRAAKHRGALKGSPYFFTSSPRRYLSRGSFSGAIFPPLLVVGRMAISNHVRTASVFPFSIRHTTLIALSR